MGRRKPTIAGEVYPQISETLSRMERDLLELKSRGVPHGSAPPFGEYAEQWFERVYQKTPKKRSTIVQRRYLLSAYLLPPLRDLPLDEIRRDAIERVRSHCKDLAPGSRNEILILLNRILTDAEEDDLIAKCPRIRIEAVVRAKKPFHETSAYLRVVKAAKRLGRRFHLTVLLAGDAGMRASECAGLEWIRIDMRARTIHVILQDYKGQLVPVKNGRERWVRMTRALFSALSRVPIKERAGRVLLGARGNPIRRGMASYWVDCATEAAGIQIAVGGAHTLRHTLVSHLVEARAPLSAVQAITGHEHLSSLQPYCHPTKVAVQRAIRLLDAQRSRSTKQRK